jgi:hypothetical protein
MSKSECEYPNIDGVCGGEVKLRTSMTKYHYSAEDRAAGKEDPNKSFYACENHWQDYYDYWREQWAEYYGSQGFPGCNPYPQAQDHIEEDIFSEVEDDFED